MVKNTYSFGENNKLKMNKKSITIYGLLTISILSNCVLTGVLISKEKGLNETTSNETISNETISNESVVYPNQRCLGKNGLKPKNARYNLGQNVWGHVCYSTYIPAWILDIRYFFNGTASIKGISLQKKQWLILDQNREFIAKAFNL